MMLLCNFDVFDNVELNAVRGVARQYGANYNCKLLSDLVICKYTLANN